MSQLIVSILLGCWAASGAMTCARSYFSEDKKLAGFRSAKELIVRAISLTPFGLLNSSSNGSPSSNVVDSTMHSRTLTVSLLASSAKNGPTALSYPEVFPASIAATIGFHMDTISWNVPNLSCVSVCVAAGSISQAF